MSRSSNNSYDNLYTETIITRKVRIPYTAVGKKLQENLKIMISRLMEGKCSKEGYIQVGTMQILTYSIGLQIAGDVEFEVVIKCYVCCPVNGMQLPCVVKNITSAGIRAECTYDQELNQQKQIIDNINKTQVNPNSINPYKRIEDQMGKKENYNSPIVVYLATADQKNTGISSNFSRCKPNDAINIEVIGQRFELNDKHVNIIGILK